MIELDVHEPERATTLFQQSNIETHRRDLNVDLWADYRWKGVSGDYTQVERKTWGEILAGLDSVEDQLRRHKTNQPGARLLFVLEGMVSEDGQGTYTLRENKGQTVWMKGYRSATRLSRIYSWLYNASQYVEVFQTMNYNGTVQFLAQAHNQDQKTEAEHKTFNRYFKKMTFIPNPQVMQLMGLLPGLGEAKSEALINQFTTVWQVLNASPEELQQVPGIGKTTALNLLQRIGRTDV